MGQTFSVPIVSDMNLVVKRGRPANWTVATPPPKRIKIFHDTGAKAPNLDKIVEVS